MTVKFQEEVYGPEALSLADLANSLLSQNWFSELGNKNPDTEKHVQELMNVLKVSNCDIKWVSKENISAKLQDFTFSESEVWDKLKDVPDQLKLKIDEKENNALLESMVDTVPEAVFHPAYAGAFKMEMEEKVISYLVGNAMYISILICTAAIAGQSELSQPLLDIVLAGHTILGLEGNTLYLA